MKEVIEKVYDLLTNVKRESPEVQRAIEVLSNALYVDEIKKSTFNMYNYVSDKGLRYVLTGVCFEVEGFQVATDSTILVAVKNERIPLSAVGKILDKNGLEIEAKYVGWRSVMPTYETGIDVSEFTMLAMLRELKRLRTERKASKNKDYYQIKFGTTWLDPAYFEKFLLAAVEIEATFLLNAAETQAIAARSYKGWVLLMPMKELYDIDCFDFNETFENELAKDADTARLRNLAKEKGLI